MKPWARMREHGPCMIFDWHATEAEAQQAIEDAAKRDGEQVRKFMVVGFFPHRAATETIGDKLKRYIALKTELQEIEIACPTCGAEADVFDSPACECCGATCCDECVKRDAEGVPLCQGCR